MRASREDKYRIPESLIEYLCGLTPDCDVLRATPVHMRPKRKRVPDRQAPLPIQRWREESEIASHYLQNLYLWSQEVEGESIHLTNADVRDLAEN